jgi:hypothetical protein
VPVTVEAADRLVGAAASAPTSFFSRHPARAVCPRASQPGPVAPASPVPAPDFAPLRLPRPILSQHVCTNDWTFKPLTADGERGNPPDRSGRNCSQVYRHTDGDRNRHCPRRRAPAAAVALYARVSSHQQNAQLTAQLGRCRMCLSRRVTKPQRRSPVGSSGRGMARDGSCACPRMLRGRRVTARRQAGAIGIDLIIHRLFQRLVRTARRCRASLLGVTDAGHGGSPVRFRLTSLASAILRMTPVIRFEASSERKARSNNSESGRDCDQNSRCNKVTRPTCGARRLNARASETAQSRRTRRPGNFLDRADGDGFGRQRVFFRD